MYRFTEGTATKILKALSNRGYGIDPGLSDKEVSAVEKAFKATLPPDFRIFLQVGVIGKGAWQREGVLPDWRSPDKETMRYQDYIEEHVFRFDIEKGGYWYKEFGKKPRDTEEAVRQALAVVRTWPPLFPIFGHRFIPSNPHKPGNPVLSVWQAADTIYYGENILDYMDMEFKLGPGVAKQYPNGVAVQNPEPVPYWGDAFDLRQQWMPLHPPFSDPR